MSQGLPRDYFDRLYAGTRDPWNYAHSPYEAAKYAATLKALPRPRYGCALEIGCSIGILTRELATRCVSVIGIDVAEAALAQARAHNAGLAHVKFLQGQFPSEMPDGLAEMRFDLILLSEILYYLDAAALVAAADATLVLAGRGADILLVNWLGPTPDCPMSGDEAAEAFIAALRPAAVPMARQREQSYRIDLLQRRASG